MKSERFIEIDLARALAVIMMIIFHALFDLNFFAQKNFNLDQGFWLIFARLTASIFILLTGLSLSISYTRAKIKNLAPATCHSRPALCHSRAGGNLIFFTRKLLPRALKIGSWALVITAITTLFFPSGTIYFGILHFIALSIILSFPFLKLKNSNLIIAAGIFLIWPFINLTTEKISPLIIFNIPPRTFYTFDYFPLIPWFGLILLGIYLGKILYPNATRHKLIAEKLAKLEINNPVFKAFSFVSQNSLLIYLLHQPLLILLIYLIL